MPSKAKKSRPNAITNTKPLPATIPQSASAVPPTSNGQSQRDSESKTGDTTESAGEPTTAPTVNRKKQKRREKEAAKRAAQAHQVNGHFSNDSNGQTSIPSHQDRGPPKGYFPQEPDLLDTHQPGYVDGGSPDDAFYSGDEDPAYEPAISGPPNSSWLNTSRRKRSKRSKENQNDPNAISTTSTTVSRSTFPTVSNAALRSAHRMGDSLWNPTSQAERENIKQFWLDLGEEERRALVKIEKEAVLRKMKEQQKHSCSCSVCGRKRTAIEEELEVLYDAYYQELEQFAHHNPHLATNPQLMPPPTASIPRPHPIPGSFSSRGRVQEMPDEDDDYDEGEEYDEEDEMYSDEEDDYDDHGLPPGPPDFFHFGNSLQVKGMSIAVYASRY